MVIMNVLVGIYEIACLGDLSYLIAIYLGGFVIHNKGRMHQQNDMIMQKSTPKKNNNI